MPIPTPGAILTGTRGTLLIGGVPLGVLTSWRVVISPTTGRHTLIADGHIQRYAYGAVGETAEAHLIPAPIPARIGRPRPPTRPPCRIVGTLVRAQPGGCTIATADLLPA